MICKSAEPQGLSPQTSDPKYYDGGEGDGVEEDVSASLVAGSDAAPVLQAAEGIPDAVSLPVKTIVVSGRSGVGRADLGRKVFVDSMFEIGENAGDRSGEYQHWYKRYWQDAVTCPPVVPRS